MWRLAAFFLAVIANAMNLIQIDSKYQALVLGAVLIVALASRTTGRPLRGGRHEQADRSVLHARLLPPPAPARPCATSSCA